MIKVVRWTTVSGAISDLEYITQDIIPSAMGMRGMSKAQLIDRLSEVDEELGNIMRKLSWAKTMYIEDNSNDWTITIKSIQ